MLWLKTLHVVFVVSWFATLFFLPRLFVYHLETQDPTTRRNFQGWERRTYVLGHVAFGLALLFGVWYVLEVPAFLKQGWLHAKLALIALLFGYWLWCGRIMKALARDAFSKSSRWLRLFNEVPAAFLFGIVALAIVKPF